MTSSPDRNSKSYCDLSTLGSYSTMPHGLSRTDSVLIQADSRRNRTNRRKLSRNPSFLERAKETILGSIGNNLHKESELDQPVNRRSRLSRLSRRTSFLESKPIRKLTKLTRRASFTTSVKNVTSWEYHDPSRAWSWRPRNEADSPPPSAESIAQSHNSIHHSQNEYFPNNLDLEDLPVDFLEGKMDLMIVLPSGKTVRMAVERRTPMMDLLVQVTTANKISPGGHVIQVMNARSDDFLFYKPSTPIGALDTSKIHIIPKNLINEAAMKKAPMKVLNQPFRTTFRLQIRLPRNQLSVLRVSHDTTVMEVLKEICEEKDMDPNHYEIRRPDNAEERLNPTDRLSECRVTEVVVVPISSRTSNRSVSTSDILRLQQMDTNKSRMLHSVKTRSSAGDSSVSSGSLGCESPSRSLSPINNNMASTASPSMPNSRNRLPQRPVRPRKKRPAPPPPTTASVVGVPILRDDGPKTSTPIKAVSMSNLTNIPSSLAGSTTSINSVGGRNKRRAPPPPRKLPVVPILEETPEERKSDISEASRSSLTRPAPAPRQKLLPSQKGEEKASSEVQLSSIPIKKSEEEEEEESKSKLVSEVPEHENAIETPMMKEKQENKEESQQISAEAVLEEEQPASNCPEPAVRGSKQILDREPVLEKSEPTDSRGADAHETEIKDNVETDNNDGVPPVIRELKQVLEELGSVVERTEAIERPVVKRDSLSPSRMIEEEFKKALGNEDDYPNSEHSGERVAQPSIIVHRTISPDSALASSESPASSRRSKSPKDQSEIQEHSEEQPDHEVQEQMLGFSSEDEDDNCHNNNLISDTNYSNNLSNNEELNSDKNLLSSGMEPKKAKTEEEQQQQEPLSLSSDEGNQRHSDEISLALEESFATIDHPPTSPITDIIPPPPIIEYLEPPSGFKDETTDSGTELPGNESDTWNDKAQSNSEMIPEVRRSSRPISFSIDSYDSRSLKEEPYSQKLVRSESMTLPKLNSRSTPKKTDSFSSEKSSSIDATNSKNNKFSTLPVQKTINEEVESGKTKEGEIVNNNNNNNGTNENEDKPEVPVRTVNVVVKKNPRKFSLEGPKIVPNDDLLLNQARRQNKSLGAIKHNNHLSNVGKSNSVGNLHKILTLNPTSLDNENINIESGSGEESLSKPVISREVIDDILKPSESSSAAVRQNVTTNLEQREQQQGEQQIRYPNEDNDHNGNLKSVQTESYQGRRQEEDNVKTLNLDLEKSGATPIITPPSSSSWPTKEEDNESSLSSSESTLSFGRASSASSSSDVVMRENKYSYAGPPSITMSTWGDRKPSFSSDTNNKPVRIKGGVTASGGGGPASQRAGPEKYSRDGLDAPKLPQVKEFINRMELAYHNNNNNNSNSSSSSISKPAIPPKSIDLKIRTSAVSMATRTNIEDPKSAVLVASRKPSATLKVETISESPLSSSSNMTASSSSPPPIPPPPSLEKLFEKPDFIVNKENKSNKKPVHQTFSVESDASSSNGSNVSTTSSASTTTSNNSKPQFYFGEPLSLPPSSNSNGGGGTSGGSRQTAIDKVKQNEILSHPHSRRNESESEESLKDSLRKISAPVITVEKKEEFKVPRPKKLSSVSNRPPPKEPPMDERRRAFEAELLAGKKRLRPSSVAVSTPQYAGKVIDTPSTTESAKSDSVVPPAPRLTYFPAKTNGTRRDPPGPRQLSSREELMHAIQASGGLKSLRKTGKNL